MKLSCSWYARGVELGGNFAAPMDHTVLQTLTKSAKSGVMTNSQGAMAESPELLRKSRLGSLTFVNIFFIPLALTTHEFLWKMANCSFIKQWPQDGQLLKAKALLTIALYMEHHLEFQVPWDSITFYREIMSEANI